eukprot:m.142426 g.142426  ORF g.142426 m.142426 type:complete len:114 (-) comp14057_c1_seq1:1344-1685(-)
MLHVPYGVTQAISCVLQLLQLIHDTLSSEESPNPFALVKLCRSLNVKQEFKLWKGDAVDPAFMDSFFNYPFVLVPDTKRQIIRLEAARQCIYTPGLANGDPQSDAASRLRNSN